VKTYGTLNIQESYTKSASTMAQSANSTATATNNISDEFKIKVFPNPSNGRFTVQFSDMPDSGSRIDILDLSGKTISTRNISEISEEFNLDNQPAGIYLVKTIIGSSQIIHKLLVNK
jgi:hypothetical protein